MENLGVDFHHTPISDSTLQAKTLGEIWTDGKALVVFVCGWWRGDGGGDEGWPTSMEPFLVTNPQGMQYQPMSPPNPETS